MAYQENKKEGQKSAMSTPIFSMWLLDLNVSDSHDDAGSQGRIIG